jgi:hypothetical protein
VGGSHEGRGRLGRVLQKLHYAHGISLAQDDTLDSVDDFARSWQHFPHWRLPGGDGKGKFDSVTSMKYMQAR